MVRKYVRKTERQKWDKDVMNDAVSAIIEGNMGYRKASSIFRVPKTTLERYVQKMKNSSDKMVKVTKAGAFKTVFTKEQEKELCNYIISMEQRLFGLTSMEVRSLAFQLAEKNNLHNSFNKETQLAGVDWLHGFMQRHSNISLRKPEATSAARAMGFNKVSVKKYFDLLTSIVQTRNITADRIFNVDETGVTVNPKQQSRIVACKGRRQVGAITSADRGETVTAVVCISAAGNYMPPMLIFPRKRMQQEFQTGLPPGSWAEVHSSGWINKNLFLSWFKKFIDFSKPSSTSPVLLLLDGHRSHTINLDVIDLAREKDVILLCFPPHCSHRLQPLDVSFFKPLSKYYEDAVRKWLRHNPGRVVTLLQIATLFGEAFVQSANMSTAINGFRKSGAWPTDMNVFTEVDFLPADPTDIALGVDEVDEEYEIHNQDTNEGNCPEMLATTSTIQSVDQPETSRDYNQPGTSRDYNQPGTFRDYNQPGTFRDYRGTQGITGTLRLKLILNKMKIHK
ncbi:PREDICTED: uncharacterized protein LOC105566092 isoform X2 [Vollenhovia emeryi]|uniref:uncharacterized protein LOC105566092 isoform X2 n=1 Tax=Vollenhovia emeryi TaxID=411798 RepID=UPI0005F36540|nr:PREDICTED: uncharacterized protein LOC105566092 isoform X2 [Vollenhovia emeryi]